MAGNQDIVFETLEAPDIIVGGEKNEFLREFYIWIRKLHMKKSGIKNRITKSDASAFARRWKIVNDTEKRMLRATSEEEKLEHLIMLMDLAKELDWKMSFKAEVNKVRDRWNKLRKVYHA